MKNVTQHISKLSLVIASLLFSLITVAQDKTVDVNISTNKGGGFMGSPWMWVVGIAVFILLLVALLRGGKRGD